MATEPAETSACYNPLVDYTPPVGRLPVLGKIRAEIDRIRAAADNDRNMIVNRDLAQIDSNAKITADIAAQATTVADNTRKIDSDIAAQTARTNNETNKTTQEIASMIQATVNDTTRATNDTTKTTNDTNRAIAEVSNNTNKTDAEVALLEQKAETELAQVVDSVGSGTVSGVIGRQKTLFEKQAAGFERDAEQKLAKILVDTWSVRQTTDGAAVDINGLSDSYIATVLTKAREGIGLT